MKYEITLTPKEKDNNDLSISLDTNEGLVIIKSYGSCMNYDEFIEFADAIQEIRQKFAVINDKHDEGNGTK